MSKKHLINGFIVVVLSVMLVDALPRTSLAHQRLKNAVDPVLDVTGHDGRTAVFCRNWSSALASLAGEKRGQGDADQSDVPV